MCDAANPDGDVEIREIGLRPGEKLYEELLIDRDMLPTPHDKILRAQEEFPGEFDVRRVLASLEREIVSGDAVALKMALSELVAGFGAGVEEVTMPDMMVDLPAAATPAE